MREFRSKSVLSIVVHLIVILIVSSAVIATSQTAPVKFGKAIVYDSGGSWVYSVAVQDLNGDGHPDLVVANLCGNYNCYSAGEPGVGEIGVLLGNGDGTFRPVVVYSSGGYDSHSVVIGDVNGDGKPDLVVANLCQGSDCTDGSVSVLLGNGDGSFQSPISYSAGENAYSVAVADLNGDGNPDIVAGNCMIYYASICNSTPSSLGVLLGNGDGTFQPPVSYGMLSGGTSVAIADVNGDGRPDVVVGGGVVSVLLGNGDGTLRSPIAYDPGGGEAESVAIGDVNGDGKPDLLVAKCCGNDGVGMLLGNGDGTFQRAVSYSSGPASVSIAIADVNGDGHPDLAVAGGSGHYGYVYVLVGKGDGTFQAPVTYSSGSNNGPAQSIALADIDGDGKPGVVVGNWGIDTAGVLRNIFSAKTTTMLVSSLNPSMVGQFVTFTATVASNPAVPSSEAIDFYDGANLLKSVQLVGGVATYSTSALPGRDHWIYAKYLGDTWRKPSMGSVQQDVLKYATRTTLTSSPNPSNYGQTATFTATVTPTGPYPLSGKVKFWDGTTALGAVALSGTVATLKKPTLAIGTHVITAQYLSDSYNDKSTSNEVDQVVQ